MQNGNWAAQALSKVCWQTPCYAAGGLAKPAVKWQQPGVFAAGVLCLSIKWRCASLFECQQILLLRRMEHSVIRDG